MGSNRDRARLQKRLDRFHAAMARMRERGFVVMGDRDVPTIAPLLGKRISRKRRLREIVIANDFVRNACREFELEPTVRVSDVRVYGNSGMPSPPDVDGLLGADSRQT